jgi:hypothetical protein
MSPAVAASQPNRFDEREVTVTQRKHRDELTAEELRSQNGEELPEREAMSLVDANVAAPVNAAAALNVLSDDSTAVANAQQSTEIAQSQ